MQGSLGNGIYMPKRPDSREPGTPRGTGARTLGGVEVARFFVSHGPEHRPRGRDKHKLAAVEERKYRCCEDH